MPRVSILIPVYNARAWLAAAISSALNQTERSLEVVVLDDGSTDGSIEVARSFGGRIRVEQQSNRGQNASRNALTALSSGEWLVYLDADDELAADAVEAKLSAGANADAVYGTMTLQQYQGTEIVGSQVFMAADHADPFAAAFFWKYPNTSSFMIRRSAVAGVGGFLMDSRRSRTSITESWAIMQAAPRTFSSSRTFPGHQ